MKKPEQERPCVKCLIVEDDEDYVYIIRSYLQDIPHYECEVDWEPDFDKVLGKLRNQTVSVCFVDYFLGAHNGIELVRAASQEGTSVPLVLLTGSTDPALFIEASSAGATDFLLKEEISATTLSRTIRFALAKGEKSRILRQRQAKLEETTRALAEQRTLLRLALDHTRHGIALFDAESRLEDCNAKYLEIYGFSREDIHPGLRIDEILQHSISLGNFTVDEAKRILSERLAQVESATPSTYHQRLRDGRTIAIMHEPIKGGRSVTTCEDITELLSSQRQSAVLARSAALADAENTAKTKFLSNMSHELRTPLNAIIGFAEAMCLEAFEAQGKEQYKAYAKYILESAQSLSRTVEQVLDMSLIHADELDMEEEDFLLINVVSATVRRYRETAGDKKIKVHVLDGSKHIRFRGDCSKIAQAVENILDNAVKFCLPHGMIVVSLELDGEGNAIIAVSDTGSGIPQDQINSILAPFEQQEAAEARQNHGAGLGLPIAQGLVRLHGGSILMDSAPGLGTTVKIVLPATRVLSGVPDSTPSRLGSNREDPQQLKELRVAASGLGRVKSLQQD